MRLYVTRPRGDAYAESWTELAIGMLKTSIGIYFSLKHQWRPGALQGTWIARDGEPEVHELSATAVEIRGTLDYHGAKNDVPAARERYRVLATRTGKRWTAQITSVVDRSVSAAM